MKRGITFTVVLLYHKKEIVSIGGRNAHTGESTRLALPDVFFYNEPL
jgi:hypothetical protein